MIKISSFNVTTIPKGSLTFSALPTVKSLKLAEEIPEKANAPNGVSYLSMIRKSYFECSRAKD